ncbi:3-oxoacyl-[acyl-carrier-protein] reductase FabG isoform X4 [Dermacentor silvarum]|uniref:3-oxoacyl-[acyl-carrier-protein] reductase FabG isoform X4 n=1 Tax=Dermacentor silvarum TaxID=543639 RepID=UPI002100985C|nr:3-oxoacyl-[acyl-carrier-protein] reductase FabG isoform X4 [Dermacentor silvarum]
MLNMNRKVALITGASTGIGEGTALRFASLGCWLSLTARNRLALEEVAEKCRAKGVPTEKVLVVQGDINSDDDIAAIVKKTADHFGKIDILVNNAGMAKVAPLEGVHLDEFDEVHNTNLRSAFNMTQQVLPYLKKTKGNIVNVSSIATLRSSENISPYAISKAGLDQLTRSSALEFGQYGIRVNSVNPSVIDTPMATRHFKKAEQKEKVLSMMGAWQALGRVGTVDEVASAIAFLASDDASFITGHLLPVDGGSLLLGGLKPMYSPEAEAASTLATDAVGTLGQ